MDLKISKPDDDKIEKYKTQLGAYKFALENPAKDKPIKVTKLGLLIFYPDKVEFKKDSVKFEFPPIWMNIPVDDKGFLEFAGEIENLLSGSPPAEGENCGWCEYRHKGEEISHIQKG